MAQQSGEPEDFTIHLNDASYRITRAQGRTQVEAVSGTKRCLLETVKLGGLLMPDLPRYLLA